MKPHRIAFALALVAAPAGAHQAPLIPPAAIIESEGFELEVERHDRLTVAVSIAGAGPYEFLVDTGAQATVLSRELADSLGLGDRRAATLIGVASRVAAETVAIDGLTLGRNRTNLPNAPLVERRHIGGADGVLGIDALQGQRVMLDFESERMTVARSVESGGNAGYEIIVRARTRHGQLIITNANIGGVRTAVVIDTGAQGSIANDALARRLNSRKRGSNTMTELTDINGTVALSNMHVVDVADFGRMKLRNLLLFHLTSPVFAALDLEDRPAMILGMRELRGFKRVAIDFDSRRVLFDMPS